MDPEVFLGLLAVVALALAATLALAWRTRTFLARCTKASGTVSRVVAKSQETMSYGGDHPSRTVTDYTTHVVFNTVDGSRVEFESRVSHPTRMYDEGQVVAVVYEPADPQGTAEIAGA